MAEPGFIKLYRSLSNWEWYSDSKTKDVFIHCLIMANYEQKQWQGITIERGSFVTSQSKIALQLGLTTKQVRRALDNLKRTGEVAVKTTNKYSLIKVLNYDCYQQEGRQTGTQRADKGQTKGEQVGTQRATTKEIKNIRSKEIKNIKTYSDLICEFSSDLGLRAELENFVEMRKKEKGFTVHALEINLDKLAKMSSDPAEQTEIVRQSIERSWKGLFPLKQNQPVQRVQPNQRQDVIPDWKQEEQAEDVDWEEFQKIRQQLKEKEGGLI